MSNKIIWFNIGQKGSNYVTWQCAIINENCDPESIKFEDWEEDNEGNIHSKWVSKDKLKVPFHKSVENSFSDLNKVAEWVKQNYKTGEDVYVGNGNWTHIYEVFDLDNTNEYGVALPAEWAGSEE